MSFLPVVERELRVRARLSSTYWARSLACVVAVAAAIWIWFGFGTTGISPTRGQQIFGSIAVLGLIYSLLAGFFWTADSISQEKRDGTLGLLFLTSLRGYDVTFGKLFATSIHCVFWLVAMLPVMAIPVLLGGVTGGDFTRVSLTLLVTLYLSLALGMLVSVCSRSEHKSRLALFLALLFFLAALPSFSQAAVARWIGFSSVEHAYVLSPIFTFSMAFDSQYKTRPFDFWTSILAIIAVASMALGLASLLIIRVWQDKADTSAIAQWRARSHTWQTGNPSQRLAFRTKLLEINPIFWLASRRRIKPFVVLGFLGLAAAFWLWGFFKQTAAVWLHRDFIVVWAIGLHSILKFWVASEAPRLFSEEKRSGGLELVFSSPLQVSTILQGQWLGLVRQFGLPVIIVFVADCLLATMGDRRGSPDSAWLYLAGSGIVIFVLDCVTLAWLGMWQGLISKNAFRATSASVFYVLVIPWLMFFGLITMGINSILLRDPNSPTIAWFMICFVLDILFLFWAHTSLRREFREIIAHRFDKKSLPH